MKTTKAFATAFSLLLLLLLSGCSAQGTKIGFSFSTSTPANSSSEKVLYTNANVTIIKLDGTLKIKSGTVDIQVIDNESGDVKWANTYTEDAKMVIELNDLLSEHEYIISVDAQQSTDVRLTLTSPDKFIQDKEKPDRFIVSK